MELQLRQCALAHISFWGVFGVVDCLHRYPLSVVGSAEDVQSAGIVPSKMATLRECSIAIMAEAEANQPVLQSCIEASTH